jgi:hypothetical protein
VTPPTPALAPVAEARIAYLFRGQPQHPLLPLLQRYRAGERS